METQLAEAGVRAVALRRYKMSPAAQEQQGIMVVSYSDLEQEQLPQLIQVLEQITTQAS